MIGTRNAINANYTFDDDESGCHGNLASLANYIISGTSDDPIRIDSIRFDPVPSHPIRFGPVRFFLAILINANDSRLA